MGVEGHRESVGQKSIGVARGKPEQGVRLEEVCRGTAAGITESPPIDPLRHSAVNNRQRLSKAPFSGSLPTHYHSPSKHLF